MKRQPIGYLPLCQILLDNGVSSQAIIKHRFVLQAMAACMYAEPTEIDHDQFGFAFTIANPGPKKTRTAQCSFATMHGRAIARLAETDPQGRASYKMQVRLSLTTTPTAMLWVFPIEDDFTLWERFQIWIENVWARVRTGLRLGQRKEGPVEEAE